MNLDLKSLSKAELISLLRELEDAEPGMVSKYLESWNTSPYYRGMKQKIKAVLNPMLDRGFLARKHVRPVIAKMQKLLREIEQAYHNGQNDKAFGAAMAMIETWNLQLNQTDDSSGYVSPLVDSCWAIVDVAVIEEYDPEIRLSFANYLLKIIKADSLRGWDWWINPIELLRDMDAGPEIERELLAIVNSPQGYWDLNRLAKTRLYLTERVEGKQAAAELKSSLMHLDTIRLKEIEVALDQCDYQRAKDLCIQAADPINNQPWKRGFWMARLLEIAEFEGDKDSQKVALTHLVLHGSTQVKEHWAKLRPLLSDLEANQIIKSIITPDSNKMLNISNETAIVLLGSEGLVDQLLLYLSDHRSPQALKFAEHFLQTNKEALAQLWKQEILDRLVYSYSSQNAWMFAEYLQIILRLVGSEAAQSIKNEVLKVHPHKTALKARLDEIV